MGRLGLFFAMCSALFSISAHADPQVVTRYKHYTINPASLNDLVAEINRQTPVEQNGAKYHGLASWNVSWNIWWTPVENGCRMERVQTGVDIEYIMPQLGTADEKTRQRFDAYYAALKVHEDGHGQHGVMAAQEIERVLSSMPVYATCKELEAASTRIAMDIVARFNKSDVEYDLVTQHGATQGAWLHDSPIPTDNSVHLSVLEK